MVICNVCKQEVKHYAKGICGVCYSREYGKTPKAKLSKIFSFEKNLRKTDKWREYSRKNMRIWRARTYFGLTIDEYNKIATKCAICGFDTIVEIHHKDKNNKNNNISNLVPLCPNHHRMAHMNLVTFEEK